MEASAFTATPSFCACQQCPYLRRQLVDSVIDAQNELQRIRKNWWLLQYSE